MRLPDYRKRLGERLGFYPFKLEKCIWVHAVSVGETLAAVPLIKKLLSAYPDLPLLITTMTPTGAARVKTIFQDKVKHVYIPYDVPFAVRRFLQTMNPKLSIIMETELWPNLFSACAQSKIPICLINARLSAKSLQGYQRIAPLTRDMLKKIAFIAAHGQADAKRFAILGMPENKIVVTGNIKFDLELPDGLQQNSLALRELLGRDRFVWIAASTHADEEIIILNAHEKLRKRDPQALLILVPRHPDRFQEVLQLSAAHFEVKQRSLLSACTAKTGVYLGDTMGELLLMYGAADVAFVGGSLIARGGHNMLEPAALGKPILTGPSLYNFAEISELFIAANALVKINDATSLADELIVFAENAQRCREMGTQALHVIHENRGALEKQFALINRFI